MQTQPTQDGPDATASLPGANAVDDAPLSRLETMWLAVHPRLAQATLDAAEADSQSMAFVRVAELLARKARLRLAAITELHEKDVATAVELKTAQNATNDAEAELAQARGVSKRRQETWTSLKHRLTVPDAVLRKSQRNPDNQVTVPADDADALRHFIALHVAQFQAVAKRSESEIEAQLLNELVQRLERTGLDHQSARRERQLASLDRDIAMARSQAAGEQYVALQHETQRFAATVATQHQDSMVDHLVISAASLVAARLAISYLQWPNSPFFSCAPPHSALISFSVPRCFSWPGVGLWRRCRSTILPGAYYRPWEFARRSCWTRRYYGLSTYVGLNTYIGGLYYQPFGSRLGTGPTLHPWRSASYHDFYTIGSPRFDLGTSSFRSLCLTPYVPRYARW